MKNVKFKHSGSRWKREVARYSDLRRYLIFIAPVGSPRWAVELNLPICESSWAYTNDEAVLVKKLLLRQMLQNWPDRDLKITIRLLIQI